MIGLRDVGTVEAVTRIISGFAGSLTLAVPRSGTRPTSDRVREAIFSSLEARDALDGARVLDLYAGSGALGLEALSRGAAAATFVEQARPAAAVIAGNIGRLRKAARGTELRATVATQAVGGYLASAAGPFDVVFSDPPYELTNADAEADLAALVPLLAADAVVMLERSARDPELVVPAGLVLDRRRDYGETALYWLSPADSESPEEPASPDQSA